MNKTTTLGHADAQTAIALIQAEIAKRGKAASIAVADSHGELIAFLRMDGAKLNTINIACNKAFTAAREQKPSREVGQRVRDPEKGHDISYLGDPRYVGWGGGLPVFVDGVCAGAVAVSGLPELEDIEVCELGVNAFLGVNG
ncbi:MAG: heme-binding protein [Anaerolineae bacterium]|nr:heme-binding protein [Anaerolineae bacterium]